MSSPTESIILKTLETVYPEKVELIGATLSSALAKSAAKGSELPSQESFDGRPTDWIAYWRIA